MQRYKILLTMALGSTLFMASCSDNTSSTTTTTTDSTIGAGVTTTTTTTTTQVPVLSETDSYIDLKTGKTIHIRRDPSSNVYVSDEMPQLDIYVNTNTRDTFWGPEAVSVNNALVFDGPGMWTVDEMRVERNGEGYKAKSADGELKIKENENEFKAKDGDAKVKSNEDEYKYKDDGLKIKSNENKTKIKTDDTKTEIDHKTGEVKTKDR